MPSPPAPSFKSGDEVIINGLKAKPEMNGKKAIVVMPTAEVRKRLRDTGRLVVRLLDAGGQFAVKPDNLRASDQAASGLTASDLMVSDISRGTDDAHYSNDIARDTDEEHDNDGMTEGTIMDHCSDGFEKCTDDEHFSGGMPASASPPTTPRSLPASTFEELVEILQRHRMRSSVGSLDAAMEAIFAQKPEIDLDDELVTRLVCFAMECVYGRSSL